MVGKESLMNVTSPITFFSHKHAFSLIELLVVTGILGVLMAIAAPVVSHFTSSGNATQALVQIAGTLEGAREYAVSRNTFTWVAFESRQENGIDVLYVAAIASTDGSRMGIDQVAGGVADVDGSDLVILDKVSRFENCRLDAVIPAGNQVQLPVLGTAQELSQVGFSIPSSANGPVNLDKSVMFDPSGEARVSGGLADFIQIVVVPTRETRETEASRAAASVIGIQGLTGRVKVYRPSA